jgi:predicted oxidoreductase
MWRFSGDDVAAAQKRIEAALDAGITLFDTADIYGPDNDEPFGAAEALLGRVFAQAPYLRDRMVLASKGGIEMGTPYNSSPEYLASALDASLSRMGVERIELWQVHRPDMLTHPQELARSLEDMVTSGKVGAVGVSNFTKAQISALVKYLEIPLATTQPQYSPLHLEPLQDGQFDQATELGLTILAWSPLGGGHLANPKSANERALASALDQVAEESGTSRSIAALSWIGSHPAQPIPIIGSQSPSRIAEVADISKVRWTRTSWYAVLTAAMGEPLP